MKFFNNNDIIFIIICVLITVFFKLLEFKYKKKLLNTTKKNTETSPNRELNTILTQQLKEQKEQYKSLTDQLQQTQNTLQKEDDKNKALKQKLDLQNSFFVNMSHEIRTPMNGILGMLELLKNTKLKPNQMELLDTAQNCAIELLEILNDILDISKMKMGRMYIEYIDTNILTIVQDVINLLMNKAKKKGIDLYYEVSEHIPFWLKTDPLRLKQILTNLVSNAIKFTEVGEVSLKVSIINHNQDNFTLQFEIGDTGIGISDTQFNNLFDEFTQANKSTARLFGGSGLGLSISKHLIELMEGKLTVKSELKLGSTFTVTLNLIKSSSKLNNKTQYSEKSKPNTHKNNAKKNTSPLILIVEDNEVNEKITVNMLHILKVQKIDIARSGEQAIKKRTKKKYDLIFMDCQMPNMNGYETTQLIRLYEEKNKTSKIPIIALTANTTTDDKAQCIDAGMDDYLSKPINLQAIESMLQKWLPKTNRNEKHEEHDIINQNKFQEVKKIMKNNFSSLIYIYIENTTKIKNQILDALEKEDFESIRLLSHTLKSSSQNLGLIEIGSLAQEIEEYIIKSEPKKTIPLIKNKLNTYINNATEYLKKEI